MDFGAIITLIGIGGGLIAQAAYLKGSFSTRISNNEKAILDLIKTDESIHKRLNSGQDTFATIREHIAAQTSTLTHLMEEQGRVCRNIDHLRDSKISKDTHNASKEAIIGRIERLEKVANGRLTA